MKTIGELVCKLIEHVLVVSPPVINTKVSPVPPQSNTSSWTSGSTVTKLTLCSEVSKQLTFFVASSCVAGLADPTGVVGTFNT